MKKKIAVLICVFMCIGLTGCNDSGEDHHSQAALSEEEKARLSAEEEKRLIEEQQADAQKKIQAAKEAQQEIQAAEEEKKEVVTQDPEASGGDSTEGIETDSYDTQSDDGTAENICPDCGYEQQNISCGYCFGSGDNGSCKRCGGDGIICRNCFYPPTQSSSSKDSDGSSSTRTSKSKMCHRCHGSGLYGDCFSCNGTGTLGHSEYYDGGSTGSTYYTRRVCPSCVAGQRRCNLCKGDGYIDEGD